MADGRAMTRLRFFGSARIGAAISRDRLYAAPKHHRAGIHPDAPLWERALTPTSAGTSGWMDLAEAFKELADVVSTSRRELHVALLPPLASCRRLTMPGVRESEAREILKRDLNRYLPIETEEQETDVHGTGAFARSPFSLLAAPREMLEAIAQAARQSGWHLAEIVAAESAWAAAAWHQHRSLFRRENSLVVGLEDRIEILGVRRGRLLAIRRLPAATIATAVDAITNSATLSTPLLIGGSAVAAVRTQLEQRGLSPCELPDDARSAPAAWAARFASRSEGPALLPERERKERAHSERFRIMTRFAASAALLVMAGLLIWRAAERNRSRFASERARLRAEVMTAVARRDTLSALLERLTTLESRSSSAPRWSELLVSIGRELPNGAFLTLLRADGDTVRLEGVAPRASAAFDAIARVPQLRDVRPDGAIHQEVHGGAPTAERFTLIATFARRDSVRQVTSPGGQP